MIRVILMFVFFFSIYFNSFSKEYVEGEVLVEVKSTGISAQSLGHKSSSILPENTDISVKRIFSHNKKIYLIKSSTKTTQQLIEELKKNPYVEKVEPNYIIRPTIIPDDSVYDIYGTEDQYWGFEDIKAFDGWDITTGSNDIVIAVLDTGVDYSHPDLKENIWRNKAECNGIPGVDDDNDGYIDDCIGYDMHDNDNDTTDYDDHGTHVSGIIGAVGNNSIGLAGVNWHVKILPCKIFDDQGGGDNVLSAAIECLNYIVSLKKRGVNIVASNNSWAGGPGNYLGNILKDAIKESIDAGILFVTASGNEGLDVDKKCKSKYSKYCNRVYPCSYNLEGIICVTATDKNHNLPFYSNYGLTSVDIAAPGDSIYSTVSTKKDNLFLSSVDGKYDYETGTSMATPFVTGTIGLLKSINPDMSMFDIKATILHSRDILNSLKGKILSEGKLNIYRALIEPYKWISDRLALNINSSVGVKRVYIDNDCNINNYQIVHNPIVIEGETGNDSYIEVDLSYLNMDKNLLILLCKKKNTCECQPIPEDLYILNREEDKIRLYVDDNSLLDIDNDTGVVRTRLAFAKPTDVLKVSSSGGGGGCSLSKNSDFSFLVFLILFGGFFIFKKRVRSC